MINLLANSSAKMFRNELCHFKHIDGFLPPNTFLRFSSALILRLSLESKVIFLMYTQSPLTTSDLGIGPSNYSGSSELIFIGFINAELIFTIFLNYLLKLFINTIQPFEISNYYHLLMKTNKSIFHFPTGGVY